jgi:hypothetical protein
MGLEDSSKWLERLLIFAVPMILFNLPISVLAQQVQEAQINWLEICENPLIDAIITEPCHTLTTPDGYFLTEEGDRVLGCLGGGTLAILAGVPELAAMGELVGCGKGSSVPSDSNTSSVSSNSIENNESSNEPNLWNSFTDAEMFNITIPQYWNYIQEYEYSESGPITYTFNYYDELGEFAAVSLIINNSGGYSNSRELAEYFLSAMKSEDNATMVVEPIHCHWYTLNDIPSCYFSVISEIEYGIPAKWYVVLSVDPKGIESIAMFVSSTNFYDRYLPLGKQIIDSIKFDSTKLIEVLGTKKSNQTQTEHYLIPGNQTDETEFSTTQNKSTNENQPRGFEISEF